LTPKSHRCLAGQLETRDASVTLARARSSSKRFDVDVVVHTGCVEKAAGSPLIHSNAGLGYQRFSSELYRIELNSTGDTIVGDGAMIVKTED